MLNNFSSSGKAHVYQLTSVNAIIQLTALSFPGSTVSFTEPAQSITLLVLPLGTPNQPPVAKASANPTSGAAPTSPSNSASPQHVYQNAGTYTAVLTVTDRRATGTGQVALTVTPTALAAPTNPTGTAGRGSVTLRWSYNGTNQSGFYIERAPGGTTTFARVGTVGASARSFTNTVSQGTYLYASRHTTRPAFRRIRTL